MFRWIQTDFSVSGIGREYLAVILSRKKARQGDEVRGAISIWWSEIRVKFLRTERTGGVDNLSKGRGKTLWN